MTGHEADKRAHEAIAAANRHHDLFASNRPMPKTDPCDLRTWNQMLVKQLGAIRKLCGGFASNGETGRFATYDLVVKHVGELRQRIAELEAENSRLHNAICKAEAEVERLHAELHKANVLIAAQYAELARLRNPVCPDGWAEVEVWAFKWRGQTIADSIPLDPDTGDTHRGRIVAFIPPVPPLPPVETVRGRTTSGNAAESECS